MHAELGGTRDQVDLARREKGQEITAVMPSLTDKCWTVCISALQPSHLAPL